MSYKHKMGQDLTCDNMVNVMKRYGSEYYKIPQSWCQSNPNENRVCCDWRARSDLLLRYLKSAKTVTPASCLEA